MAGSRTSAARGRNGQRGHLAGLGPSLGHAMRRVREKKQAGLRPKRRGEEKDGLGRKKEWATWVDWPAEGKWANRPNGKKEESLFFFS